MECCLCEATFADDDWDGLARHIVGMHKGFRISLDMQAVKLSMDKQYVHCWCWWAGHIENYGRHLRLNDGMAAHMLAYLLPQENPF